MSDSTFFQLLIRERGWRQFEVFRRRYEAAAKELADIEGPKALATASIEQRQFLRWARGEIRSLPRTEARRILGHLFRPVPVDQLFTPPPSPGVEGQRDSCFVAREKKLAEDDVMAAAEESASFAVRVDSSNVGPSTLEQLQADISRILASYPNRPVESVFAEVRRLRDRTFELLDGRQPPHYTRDLYLAAGVLCGVLANASFDLGRSEAAETQARTAFLCGEVAGHNGLRSWVRGLQALMAYWDGRLCDAVRLADAGGEFVPESGTAAIRLVSISARAYAQLAQPKETLTALLRADHLRDRATGDEVEGMMTFPLEKQLFYRSTAHLWLGGEQHLSDAESAASQSVRAYEAAPPERRRLGELCLARMDLASALTARGDLEGAAHHVHDVLQITCRRGIDSVTKRLGQFSRELAAHSGSDSPMAIGLREAVTAHLARPRELPGGSA
ncbi:hypothetical protein ACWDR0_02805 [Streptomyces sp. NPDC003691]